MVWASWAGGGGGGGGSGKRIFLTHKSISLEGGGEYFSIN